MTNNSSFVRIVDKFVVDTKGALEAVFKTAAQDAFNAVAELTPVDTGFLRASLTATLHKPLPIRPGYHGYKPPGHVKGEVIYPQQSYSLVINSAQLGQTIYAAFTAEYAAHVEFGTSKQAAHGMVRLTVQRWPAIVNHAVAKVKATYNGK